MLSNHHTRRQPVITITPSCAHSSHHVCLIRASLRHSSSSLIWMTCRGRLAGCSSRGGDGASRDGASRDGASGDCPVSQLTATPSQADPLTTVTV